jgi:hypothetical protein
MAASPKKVEKVQRSGLFAFPQNLLLDYQQIYNISNGSWTNLESLNP